jgi:CheY-like chemotaxis protein
MSWVLAVQPDEIQAGVLREALRPHIREEVVVATSLDEALTLIDQRVPDLILIPILTSAVVEDDLISYLGANPRARHVQILGLPHLQNSVKTIQRRRSSWLPWRRRAEPVVVATPTWDPDLFTRDVIAYLANARAIRDEIELYSALGRGGGSERRSEPRFANDEVPWISYVRFGGEQAALINVSSRGALLRTQARPAGYLLRRSVSHLRHRSQLTLELEANGEIHAVGRVIRCVPLGTDEGPQYEIAFSFDESVGLHLPNTALVPVSDTEDDDVLIPVGRKLLRGR